MEIFKQQIYTIKLDVQSEGILNHAINSYKSMSEW